MIRERIKRILRRGAPALERGLRAVPTVNRRLEARYDDMLIPLEASLKPYRADYPSSSRLPEPTCCPGNRARGCGWFPPSGGHC